MEAGNDLFRTIVETSPDAFWVIDLDGSTIYGNPQLARMYGIDASEVKNLTVFDTLDAEGQKLFRQHLSDLRAGRLTHDDVECLFVRKDGSTVWTLLREGPWLDDSGRLIGVVHRLSEYAERRATYEELTQSRQRLSETQRIARVGGWDWDLTTNELHGTEALAGLYGLSVEEFPSNIESLMTLAHPDDVPSLIESMTSIGRGDPAFSFVVRFRAGPEAEWMWIRAHGVITRDQHGRALRVSGTHQDVTELMLVERALEDQVSQNGLLRAIAMSANRARGLDDALSDLRDLVLHHDAWQRARCFLVQDGRLVPHLRSPAEADADLADPAMSRSDLELASKAAAEGGSVWSSDRLVVATPVVVADRTAAILLIASAPPLHRFDMIQEGLESTAVQLARVIEREQTERTLSAARDAAMDASRQKSQFLATMSHEIRTPLNGVIGLNDLLLRSDLDEAQRRLASGVQIAGRALLAVLNDVLDFSKIEAGRIDLESVDFDVRTVFEQVGGVVGEGARSKGLELIFSCHPDVPERVNGDPTRLAQVLTNLTSNAVKFTPTGEVFVRAVVDSSDDVGVVLAVEVTDTGIGIDPDTVESLLEPFTQADSSTTRIYGGTGLGLAISKQIVEALGGELSYSPNRGGGSTFRFTARFAPSAAGSTDSRDEVARSVLAGRPSLLVADPQVPTRDRTVLVVEDNDVNQMVALGVLEALGYDGEAVGDGAQAVERIERGDVDVVLMDVQMPILDGYAATRAIRRSGYRNLPIIAMTAAAIEGERDRCLAAGMDAYLTKPIDPTALAGTLEEWLNTPVTHTNEHVTPATTPIAGLDTARLDMLRDLDPGDTSYLDRAISNFAAKADPAMAALEAAVVAAEPEQIRAIAHKLSGSASNLGVLDAANDARSLESVAADGGPEDWARQLDVLKRSVAEGSGLLKTYQSTYSGDDTPVEGKNR